LIRNPFFYCGGSVAVTSFRYFYIAKSLLVTSKSNWLRSGSVTPLPLNFMLCCVFRAADFECIVNETEITVEVSIEMFPSHQKVPKQRLLRQACNESLEIRYLI
jgi:hypothetical protein